MSLYRYESLEVFLADAYERVLYKGEKAMQSGTEVRRGWGKTPRAARRKARIMWAECKGNQALSSVLLVEQIFKDGIETNL